MEFIVDAMDFIFYCRLIHGKMVGEKGRKPRDNIFNTLVS